MASFRHQEHGVLPCLSSIYQSDTKRRFEMSRNVLSVLFLCGSFVALSKVHKFSPEFQATYDAATAPEVQEAQRKGADARIIYTVVDDDGYPITNAWVRGTWQNDYPRKTWKESFVTDTNGMFVAQAKVAVNLAALSKRLGIIPQLEA
jgi:hypothetical protein